MEKSIADLILQAEVPVRITHLDKVMFEGSRHTKLDYIRYLVQMAPILLQYLKNRRITLVRAPDGTDGERFYQRHVQGTAPNWVRYVKSEDDQKEIIVPDIATLLYYGNLGAIEFHATLGKLKASVATHLSFDLDPSTPDFEPVREVALRLRESLESLSIVPVVKTSGASGLQVFVPLAEPLPFSQTKKFVAFMATYVEQKWPNLATTERLVRDRGVKVYIDAPQHGHTKTLIAAYSVRITPTATVSTPLTWGELESGAKPGDFTIDNVPGRIDEMGDLFGHAQPSSILQLVKALE